MAPTLGLITEHEADAYRATTLGILDQHYARSLSPDLTCLQSVALQLDLAGGDASSNRATALRLLERVGLADRAESLPGALSGGEQQRVAVCAALVHRPRLLLADEPAGELDEQSAEIVYRLLGELVHDTASDGGGREPRPVRRVDRRSAREDPRRARRRGDRRRGRRPSSSSAAAAGFVSRSHCCAISERLVTLRPRQGKVRSCSQGEGKRERPRRGNRPTHLPSRAVEAVAEVRAIRKGFGDRMVLDAFGFGAFAGRFSAVVGRSGSGKTTLLHILAGLELPDDGEVLLAGDSLVGRTRDELAELRQAHVALVTQEPGLVPYLSALENVELGLRVRRADGDIGERAQRSLEEVGLGGRLRTAAARLSAGERQRVAIARALAADVSLLLVDEPTARLDEVNGREVGRLLAAAAHDRGLAVVAATHDPVLVELADDVIEMGR